MKNILTLALGLLAIGECTYAQSLDWAVRTGGMGIGEFSGERAFAITTDNNDNVISTGYFLSTVDFDPGPGSYNLIAEAYQYDIFVQKLDKNGDFLWAKAFGNTGYHYNAGESVITDDVGNVYVAGYFQGTVDFDPGVGVTNLSPNGLVGIFVLKLDANGDFVWAKAIDGGNTGSGGKAYSLALTANNDLLLFGEFYDTVDFDPGQGTFSLTSNGQTDNFLLKLDNNGDFLWAQAVGGSSYESARSIALDNQGNIYTSGYFNGMVDFDPGSGTSLLYSTGVSYIQKLDPNGNLLWVTQMADGGWTTSGLLTVDQMNGHDMTIDPNGNIYTTGSFMGTFDFDPSGGVANLTSNGEFDAFLQKFDANGNFLWVKQIGGSGEEYSGAITMDANGNLYTTGFFEGSVDFDPASGTASTANLTSNGSWDAYVLKSDPNGNFIWAIQTGGALQDAGSSITTDGVGSVYLTGHFSSTVDFDPSSGNQPLTAVATDDMFITKLHADYPLSAPSVSNALEQVSIYPNPVDDVFNLDLGDYSNATVQVFNVFGQLIDQRTITGTPLAQFELNQAPGVYLVNVQTGSLSKQFRLVKR